MENTRRTVSTAVLCCGDDVLEEGVSLGAEPGVAGVAGSLVGLVAEDARLLTTSMKSSR